MGLRLLGERNKPLGMAALQVVGLAPLVETLEPVVADRLEHPEALARMPDEALLDERFEHVEISSGHLLGCFERAAPGEDGETREELLLVLVEQFVAPLDRGPERLLARVGVTRAAEEVEAPGEAVEDLRRRKDVRTRRGKLDGKRQVVERSTEFLDGHIAGKRRPLREEAYGVLVGERQHALFGLLPQPQKLAARDEDLEVRAAGDKIRQRRPRGDDLLEGVEHEQQASVR